MIKLQGGGRSFGKYSFTKSQILNFIETALIGQRMVYVSTDRIVEIKIMKPKKYKGNYSIKKEQKEMFFDEFSNISNETYEKLKKELNQ